MQPKTNAIDRELFCEIKIQAIAIAAADPLLPPDAKAALVYIVTAHSDRQTGVAWPSLEAIGAALGKSEDTAKRIMNRPAMARYLQVIRKGKHKGCSTVYSPTAEWVASAVDRRQRERDARAKVVPIRPTADGKGGQIFTPSDLKGGQIRTALDKSAASERGENLPEKGGQICPRTEIRNLDHLKKIVVLLLMRPHNITHQMKSNLEPETRPEAIPSLALLKPPRWMRSGTIWTPGGPSEAWSERLRLAEKSWRA